MNTARHPPLLATLCCAAMLAACGGDDPAGHAPEATGRVYEPGPAPVRQLLLAENEAGNPRELRLFVPEAAGSYPLLQFQHGFVSDVDSYTELLALLASHGFVIAAPQMYGGDPSSAPSVREEVEAALDVLAWTQRQINPVLSERMAMPAVRADPTRSGLFGHSRGGQIAWRMLFDGPRPYVAGAVAGVDPVDGDAPPFPPGGTGELVIDDDPAGFGFPFPSLILGAGRGADGVPGFECAPANRNYRLFYDASAAPRYEMVANDFGHSDMLNGDSPDLVCAGNLSGQRARMRAWVSGQLAAYFATVLAGRDLRSVLRDPTLAPVAASGRFED